MTFASQVAPNHPIEQILDGRCIGGGGRSGGSSTLVERIDFETSNGHVYGHNKPVACTAL